MARYAGNAWPMPLASELSPPLAESLAPVTYTVALRARNKLHRPCICQPINRGVETLHAHLEQRACYDEATLACNHPRTSGVQPRPSAAKRSPAPLNVTSSHSSGQ